MISQKAVTYSNSAVRGSASYNLLHEVTKLQLVFNSSVQLSQTSKSVKEYSKHANVDTYVETNSLGKGFGEWEKHTRVGLLCFNYMGKRAV